MYFTLSYVILFRSAPRTRRNSRQEEEGWHAEDGREDYMAGVSNREAMVRDSNHACR